MYKLTNEKNHGNRSRIRRRAKRTEFGGLRIGVTAVAALIAGIFLGAAVSPGRAPSEKEAVFPAQTDAASAPSASPWLVSEPPTDPDASPKETPNDLFVPRTAVTPAPEPAETALPTSEAVPGEGNGLKGYPTVSLDSAEITVCIDGAPTEMLLEDYLVGVVAAEMPASSCPAALEAQAVAARTFTALRMQKKSGCKSGCTVCNDVHCCQAYLGRAELEAAWGKNYEKNIEKIEAAVRNTEGLVVTFGGKLISALYHASSGPCTENSEEVFSVALPYLVSVESFEGDAEMITVQEFSVAEVVEKLNGLYPDAEMSVPLAPTDFDVWGRTDAGRVQLIRIGGTVITGAAMRRALGLKSTRFTVSFKGDNIVFTSTGYGHGVGMSQTGANEMAKDGALFDEILLHFYTGTEISRLVFENG